MELPDKESIKISKASYTRLGTEKNERGWQCGIYSDETPLRLTIFDRSEPMERLEVEIPDNYRARRIYSFCIEGKLEGLCYSVGGKGSADAFAREFCYVSRQKEEGTGCQENYGDSGFGRSRDELCSVFDRGVQKQFPLSRVECGKQGDAGIVPDEAAVGSDMLIYKLHVRGYTKLADVENPGTFSGLAEKVSYIKELGMNAVLLMPCYEFHEVPAMREDMKNSYRTAYVNKVNYWGYTEGYYFAPKRAYCAGENGRQEFADMVSEFHANGIAVFMEIYFSWDMSPASGVEVLRFWHDTYGVDGFRVIGSDAVLRAAVTDVMLTECKLMGMNFGGDCYSYGTPEKIYNDKNRLIWYDEGFMEAARHFLRGDEDSIAEFLNKTIRHQDGHPTVNFMADQNCFTLMDMVSYERRHNEYNGENNKDGRRYNISMNCGAEGRTGKSTVLRMRIKMVKNALAMTILSASVPMLMAGDEFGISHGGNNNPYCLDDEINYIDWGLLEKNHELYAFAKELIAFRRMHSCIHPALEFTMSDHRVKGMPDLSCHSERAWYPLMEEYSHNIGLLYCGAYVDETSNVYIIYNMHTEPHEFAIIGSAGKNWTCELCSDVAGVVVDEKKRRIRLMPKTMAVFVSVTKENV